MQEGIISLMQMPRTVAAIQLLEDSKLPHLVLLTHPTTGGVTASFSMLGDVHIAEPGATIGFAGRRVIEETVKEELPSNRRNATPSSTQHTCFLNTYGNKMRIKVFAFAQVCYSFISVTLDLRK